MAGVKKMAGAGIMNNILSVIKELYRDMAGYTLEQVEETLKKSGWQAGSHNYCINDGILSGWCRWSKNSIYLQFIFSTTSGELLQINE